MRTITIDPALNGFIVQVGCQTVVFDSIATLTRELTAYLKEPETIEKQYLESAMNRMKCPEPLRGAECMAQTQEPPTCGQTLRR